MWCYKRTNTWKESINLREQLFVIGDFLLLERGKVLICLLRTRCHQFALRLQATLALPTNLFVPRCQFLRLQPEAAKLRADRSASAVMS